MASIIGTPVQGGQEGAWGSLHRVRRLSEILSPSYFRSSLAELLARGKRSPYRSTTLAEEDAVRRFDGSLSYEESVRVRDVDAVEKKAVSSSMENPIYSLGDYRELDRETKRLFEAFLAQLHRDGVRVVFFLAPYHPKVYQVFAASERYRMVIGAEKYLHGLAQARSIPLFGSYDPAALGLSGADFYDGMHLRPAALQRMVASANRQGLF